MPTSTEYHKGKAVISQKAIIVRSDGKILLLKRPANDISRPSGWDFPGGSLEHKEDPEEGIIREVLEETGLTIKNPALSRARSMLLHDTCWSILLVYIVHITSHDVVISHEHQEYKWFTKKEIMESNIPEKYKELLQQL